MTRASVVIATYRPLGAVIPLRALREQVFKGFEVVVVTEIGSKAWGDDGKLLEAIPGMLYTKVVEAPYIKYHSPAHVLNRGIDAASGEIVALLTDFAYPEANWLKMLVDALTSRQAHHHIHPPPFIGGMKCSHGTADVWTCKPHACNPPLLPLGVQGADVPDVVTVFPFQAGFNLGNAAFCRFEDLIFKHPDRSKDEGGLEERLRGAIEILNCAESSALGGGAPRPDPAKSSAWYSIEHVQRLIGEARKVAARMLEIAEVIEARHEG